jgi:hypothetical protein
MPRFSFAALMFACTGMAACAVEPSPAVAAPAREWRVLVKLIEANVDTQVIAQRAGDISGVPVRYVAAAGSRWHAIALACADDNLCEAALRRLRAATTTYDSVQREERRRALVTP